LAEIADNPILVVEDIAEIALHMKRRLMERGHNVIWAQDPADAIQIAEKASPALILTDQELPKFDLLLELVNEHPRLNQLPIAIIDINNSESSDSRVRIFPDFDALEEFVHSL
jgi:CheY-like chemotaxis protein